MSIVLGFGIAADEVFKGRQAVGWAPTENLAIPVKPVAIFVENIQEWCGHASPSCDSTAKKVTAAADLWIKFMRTKNVTLVPEASELALKIIAYESVMNPGAGSSNSRYKGLAQYARNSGAFKDVEGPVIDYLNQHDEVRAQIPELSKIPPSNKHIHEETPPPGHRKTPLSSSVQSVQVTDDNLIKGNLFLHPYVQTSALMFEMSSAYENFDKKNPGFRQLPLPYIHALVYLHHQDPDMANLILRNIESEVPVSDLARWNMSYKDATFQQEQFMANSGIYTKFGDANPRQVLHRVAELLEVGHIEFSKTNANDDSELWLPEAPPIPSHEQTFARHASAQIGHVVTTLDWYGKVCGHYARVIGDRIAHLHLG